MQRDGAHLRLDVPPARICSIGARNSTWRTPPNPTVNYEMDHLGHYNPVDLDVDCIDRIFSTIVKGLYDKACKERVPDRCTFEIGCPDLLHGDEIWDQYVDCDARTRGRLAWVACSAARSCVRWIGRRDAVAALVLRGPVL